MPKLLKHILPLVLLFPAVLAAQAPARPVRAADSSAAAPSWADSIGMSRILEGVDISVQRAPSETGAQAPTQVIDAQRMERTGAVQVSDAVRQMAGVTLKDYGGVGGMKTVSARGLGSQFCALTIDGVAVSDAQNGQVDVGRYLLGNSAFVHFTSGQQETLLQTARAYAAGNVLNMETAEPSFLPGERHRLKAGLEAGSFGYLSPSLTWEQKLSGRVCASLWANWLQSRGDYPFRLYYTASRGDSSSTERRANSQMHMGTVDANLFCRLPGGGLSVKAHYMQGFHALPGPVTYYAARGTEHSEERLAFSQAKWRRRLGRKAEMQLLGKCQYSLDLYEDTASESSVSGRLHNEYRQREGYLSAALQYSPGGGLRLAAVSDAALGVLESDLTANNDVRRLSSLNVLAAAYSRAGLSAGANVTGTFVREEAWSRPADAPSRDLRYGRLSPYAGLSVAPLRLFGGEAAAADSAAGFWRALLRPLRIRYFYKQSYRVPTFGETYYAAMTRDLRPEQARQHNLGLTYAAALPGGSLLLTLDAYRNRVKDKIVAMPVQNMYLWSMVNFGQVAVRGLDAKAEASLSAGRWRYTLTLTYAWQQALDRSDSTSKSYGHQLPYTPRHSGAAALWVESPWADFGCDVTLVGRRYSMAQNTERSLVAGYVDQGVTLSRKFLLRHGTLSLRARVLNLFNVQYEVIRSYPMMGRSYRLALTYDI